MTQKDLLFEDGGKLTVVYTGSFDGTVIVSADENEGVDRELALTLRTEDGFVERSILVEQEGMREQFMAQDGQFALADSGTFNVLKDV